MRIQATSKSAQVRLAVPAQILFSHLKSCGGSESTARVYLFSEVQNEIRFLEGFFFFYWKIVPQEMSTDFTQRLEHYFSKDQLQRPHLKESGDSAIDV